MKFLLLILLLLPLTIKAQESTERYRNVPYYVLVGDGVTDDTEALNAWGKGERVYYKGRVLNNILENGRFLITWQVIFNRPHSIVRYNTFVWQYTGYDRTDWIVHGKRTRYYRNHIIDIGMGESPFEERYER